jgi:hypothetical protein
VGYQYRELYDMSSSYLMRYSGDDGPPGDLDPADGNLPPQVNGWQEFYQHWSQQVTSPRVMGSFARDLHVDDHDFQASAFFVGPPTPYKSDVRTVTIPGATCPGQTVLVAGHPDSTPFLNTGNGSSYDDTSGITMGMAELKSLSAWWSKHHTWPARTFRVAMFDAEETGLYGSQYYADHLIPPGPQGKIVLVANMDQNGLEYPAHPAGSTQTTWGPGFWYTNVNASPIHDFSVYGGKVGHAPPALARNMTAIKHFRAALADAVAQTFARLGQKYHYEVPLENPAENGKKVSAYTQSDIAKYSPVQDDTLGRTDQVPFVAQGIPGYGIVGAYDSNDQDNPLANPPTPLTPLGSSGLPQIAGYDTPRDNMTHFNLMASGTTGGVGGQTGSVELKRALELPMAWTLDLLARPEYVGGVPHPTHPVAYFESLPNDPGPGQKVTFNGAISALDGHTPAEYAWDFGDGTGGRDGKPVETHVYTKPGWYLARLAIRASDGTLSGYEQVVKVGKPTGSRPKSNPCGVLSAGEVAAMTPPVDEPMPSLQDGVAVGGDGAGGRGLADTGGSTMLPLTGLVLLCAAIVARRSKLLRH